MHMYSIKVVLLIIGIREKEKNDQVGESQKKLMPFFALNFWLSHKLAKLHSSAEQKPAPSKILDPPLSICSYLFIKLD